MPHAICIVHVKKGLDSAIRRVESRAAELVGMQSHNVEGLQIVSYTDGQKFETHHDIGPIDDACEHVVTVVPPRRIITLFVYLNDLPEGIGTTNFPLLKPQQPPPPAGTETGSGTDCLKVQPKRGRALLFCNVLVDDPSEPGACS
jgi:prolyl 4-hydroxylase